jgi:hypothetical protein
VVSRTELQGLCHRADQSNKLSLSLDKALIVISNLVLLEGGELGEVYGAVDIRNFVLIQTILQTLLGWTRSSEKGLFTSPTLLQRLAQRFAIL